MRAERNPSQRRFETTSLPLAASFLSQITGATLLEISPNPSVDGKRLIVIRYPATQAKTAQNLIEQFHSHSLVIALYSYNKFLNAIRDRLKQGIDNHAL